KVETEDEKVTEISFNSLNGVLDRGDDQVITVGYTVKNQYTEDITKNTSGITATAGKGDAVASNGVLTITINPPSTATYSRNDQVNVSLLYAQSSAFVSGVLTVVDPAKVSDIAIVKVVNTEDEDKEP